MIMDDANAGHIIGEEDVQAIGDQDGDWTPSSEDNFKVVIRVRPPLPRELKGTALRPYQCASYVEPSAKNVTLSENLPALGLSSGNPTDQGLLYATYRFTFDHVYDQACSQEEVYACSAQQVVLSVLQGYNAAIIAYGQTGTGKTYTMEGELQGPERGIIPRTVEDIFTHIVNDPEPSSKYLVRASYLQIYNEVISDLLKLDDFALMRATIQPDRTNLMIREDRRRGVFVEGLSEWVVRSPAEVYQLMEMGQAMRATGATKLNEVSSRSHAVCIIIVEKCTLSGGADAAAAWARSSTSASRDSPPPAHNIRVGKLSLVDLAGSERVHVTGAVGKRLEESKKINASLSALGNVIAALTDKRGERPHIPYRDSKLTRILEDSLGGNCRTTMICTVAPTLEAFHESLSTLKFANRAKTIKNEAHVNEDVDQRTLLRKYERELRKLRAELQKRSKSLVDKRALLEAEEQMRRAEADKLAVLTALEKRSQELMREKQEKLALEAKITAMQSQLLVGGVGISGANSVQRPSANGSNSAAAVARAAMMLGPDAAASLEDMPAFKQLLQREQRRIRSEYELRLKELEGERQSVEEDRQQVDRYKQLLLKQRDIMIALTARLNERDEQIMALQEELETCDRTQRQLEDALDNRTAELYALRKAAAEAASSPSHGGDALNTLITQWGTASKGSGGSGRHAASGLNAVEVDGQLAHASSFSHVPSADMEALSLSQSFTANANGNSSGSASNTNALIQQLQAQNQALSQQLAAAQQQANPNTPRSQQDGETVSPQQTQLIETLAAACEAAQRERGALQQILDIRVKRMMTELMNETSGLNGLQGKETQEKLVTRLQALQGVLEKVSAAIVAAPPVLPPEVAAQIWA